MFLARTIRLTQPIAIGPPLHRISQTSNDMTAKLSSHLKLCEKVDVSYSVLKRYVVCVGMGSNARINSPRLLFHSAAYRPVGYVVMREPPGGLLGCIWI